MSLNPTSSTDLYASLSPIRAVLDRALLAFDFDGTLGRIAARPEDARLVEGAGDVLTSLARRAAGLAIVTGRPARTAVELGGFDAVPGLVVLGHYGLQRWENGMLTSPEPDPGIEAVRRSLPPLPQGALVEDKEHSIVVHTRGCADPDQELENLRAPLAALAADHGLEVVPGRYVWELRPPGIDKGSALKTLVAERKPDVVLVAGDDLGDLPLFAAAGELRIPALRIAVVSPGAPPEVAAAADVVVAGPDALIAALRWLE
jgi:trehalose 6-phosphate phosphatase